MAKLTKQFIESEVQLPLSGQRFYRDDDLPGFALRVTHKSMSYILEKRVDGLNRRITIAKCKDMSLDCAKKQACIMLGEIAKGIDPKTGKRINARRDITLREVLHKFLEIKPLRQDTQRNYHFAINRHFIDWLEMPITAITKDMVEQRHRELTVGPNRLGTSGHGRANNALKKLSALINFASDRFGTDDEPLIKSNPVSRLSRNRSWHRIHPRQGIIPDHKLKSWYLAVNTLQHEVARDFLLFLLLTGMRFGETRKLKWCHVDFENKILIVPRELTKSDREHRLPLSDFLASMLKKRYIYRQQSEWVFQSCRLREKHLSEGVGIVRKVRAKSGIHFTFHDLRRTFLTMGEKLDVPTYALKGLVNHSVSNDMTGRYLILDIERLRVHMSRITESFLKLLEIDGSKSLQRVAESKVELVEVIQLRLPLTPERIL
ncbi:MAG: integrase family protein [Candidatus Obscuribacter sp.]|jgi:integrase|nr:integrase family protein [Candidatus Obscuribacter sp.]